MGVADTDMIMLVPPWAQPMADTIAPAQARRRSMFGSWGFFPCFGMRWGRWTPFTMTQVSSEAWLKDSRRNNWPTFMAFPLWSVVAWGVGTWGSLLGSVLLLPARAGVSLLAASMVGALLTSLYSFGLSDGLKIMGGGAGMIIFNAIIVTVSVLLLVYARNMRRRGVLL
jgi:hypothetical protein